MFMGTKVASSSSSSSINGVEAYLESPLPRFTEAGWRIVWFFTISTTHLVFSSFSVEHTKQQYHKDKNLAQMEAGEPEYDELRLVLRSAEGN